MIQYNYIATIASLDIKKCIETSELAIIGTQDPRYQQLKKASTNQNKFINSFKTPFGVKILPSIIIRDSSLPKVQLDYLCSFRTSIAVSSVIYSLVTSFRLQRQFGIPTTEVFDFYPISLTQDKKNLFYQTASNKGINSLDNFKGQSNPVYIDAQNLDFEYDTELLKSLLAILSKQGKKREDKIFKSKLFRSIQMANFAMRVPFFNFFNKVDLGTSLSLWVGAFETLAHPLNGAVEFNHVSDILKSVPWLKSSLKVKANRPIYSLKAKPKKNDKTTLPVQIFGRLFNTRNMYLHGNPLPKNGFEFKTCKNWNPLFYQIPALYRSVVLSEIIKKIGSKYPIGPFTISCENILSKKK